MRGCASNGTLNFGGIFLMNQGRTDNDLFLVWTSGMFYIRCVLLINFSKLVVVACRGT